MRDVLIGSRVLLVLQAAARTPKSPAHEIGT